MQKAKVRDFSGTNCMDQTIALCTLFSHFSVWFPFLAPSYLGVCFLVQTEPNRHSTHCDRRSAESDAGSVFVASLIQSAISFHSFCQKDYMFFKSTSHIHEARIVSCIFPIWICPCLLSLGKLPWLTASVASSKSAISILKPFTSLCLSMAINSITTKLIQHNLAPVYFVIHIQLMWYITQDFYAYKITPGTLGCHSCCHGSHILMTNSLPILWKKIHQCYTILQTFSRQYQGW